jgi:NAD(P)-dependent dehydrogenase (short-subunit alcohol dehydrogenase family)
MADSLDGTTALVTGATNGIGRVTARELARRGARVLFVARDRARGEATAAEIREASGGRPPDLLVADLSSQREVRRLAQEVRDRTPRLDLLVNNAGAIFEERKLSADGLEMTFALNHLAYFLLTLELLPLVAAGSASRIVNVSSVAHVRGAIDFDDLQGERGYSMWRAYQQSKLANVLFTRELARRLGARPGGRGVTTNALHPGAIASGFGRNGRGFFSRLVAVGAPFLASPERGARTTLHVATAPELAGVTGRYFSGCREKTPSKAAQDDAAALRLWQVSEKLALSSTRLPPP